MRSEIKKRAFNEKLVKLNGKARVEVNPKQRPNNGIQTTTSIWDSGEFTRAVYAMKFKFGGQTPSKANNWLLEENPW